MFQPGDRVVYGFVGVCEVQTVGIPTGMSAHIDQPYYTLAPLYSTEMIYIPVAAHAMLRSVLSRQEVLALIDRIPTLPDLTFDTRDQRLLAQQYRSVIAAHRCEELLRLIRWLYMKNQRRQNEGKKLGRTEEQYQKLAKELLYGEFAVALDIPPTQVEDFILAQLEKNEKTS